MRYDDDFLKLCIELLTAGKIYKYKELCSLLNEDTKKGNAKKSQLKRWSRFFSWENPTTHTYKIIEIYSSPKDEQDGRKGNGGARINSGAKQKVKEEFDYLFNAFLHREFNRNSYNGQAELCVSYFSNSEIGRYFGMYNNMFYKAKEDFAEMMVSQKVSKGMLTTKTNEFIYVWKDINKKITEKRRSWIYNKIAKVDGVTLENGIIAYTDKKDKEFEYKDEYLDKWESYMHDYIKNKKLKNESDVADNGLWMDMIAHISDRFDGYESVERTKKITFDVHLLHDYDWDRYDEFRRRFNNKLVDDIISYFEKRVDKKDIVMYRYIINKYVKL